MRDAGCGQHAREHDVGTFGAQAGNERGFEHRARATRVTTDDEGAVGAEDPRSGTSERGDELDRQFGVRDAAYTIGAEAEGHLRRVRASALRVLRSLARLFQAVLAPLLLAGVTRQEPGLLQARSRFVVEADERACDAEP